MNKNICWSSGSRTSALFAATSFPKAHALGAVAKAKEVSAACAAMLTIMPLSSQKERERHWTPHQKGTDSRQSIARHKLPVEYDRDRQAACGRANWRQNLRPNCKLRSPARSH